MGPYGDAIQKMCDAEDWADPRFKMVVRDALGLRPRIHARQWEGTAAFIALADAGKLHPASRGIGFGSGREPLTFALGARVAQLVATDLYEAGTAWPVARTADPLAFVMASAPDGFPSDRLSVHHMDMRQITYPDAQFDFCYSISAFEHIGDDADFVQHCREVRRVLKPDGIYALTTEVLLGDATRCTRGNYAFAVDHLLRIFAEGGLQAAPVVDMRLSDLAENDPRSLVATRHDDPAEPMIQSLTLRDQNGFVSAPVTFLLRPAAGALTPVQVVGREASRQQAERERLAQQRRRFSNWVRINPWGRKPRAAVPAIAPWRTEPTLTGERVFSTAHLEYGTARMTFQVAVTPMPSEAGPATIDLRVIAWQPGIEGSRRFVHRGAVTVNATPGAAAVTRIEVPTEAGTVYAVAGMMVGGSAVIAAVDVLAKRTGAR